MRIVKISNDWDRDLVIPHNGEMFVIKPGKTKIIPWDAAASLFGDPRARDDGKVKGRREIFDHVRGLHNFHLGFDTETVEDAERAHKPVEASWEWKCPKFTAWDASSDEGEDAQIYFVIHDPDGLKSFNMVTESDGGTDAKVLAQALSEMRAQMAAMQAQLNVSQGKEVKSPEPATVKPDGEHGTIDTTEAGPQVEPVGGETVELPVADPKSAPRRDSPRSVRAS